jgi:hypothetical protein
MRRTPAHTWLAVAQHEAAHVVVGAALGLRLVRAEIAPADAPQWDGCATFAVAPHHAAAWALTLAAGIAWERAATGRRRPRGAALDARLLRELVPGRHAREAHVRAAAAMLATMGGVHARVTRALLERAVGAADVAALARGERALDAR